MNPESLRADMPALEETIYFNTGASGPSPRRVVDAVSEFLTYHAYEAPGGEGMYPAAWGELEDARETVADFLGADAADIGLTRCTADGVNMIANGIDWEAGDVVVRTDLEHPAGILPWRRLADRRGVETRVVPTERGRLDLDDVKDAVEGARLVTLSSLTWTHGTRLPVSEVVDVAHDAGARVLVDAVQSPGQMPVDVREWGADFVAAAAHKWLLGIWGGGYLYVSPDAVDALDPHRIGYRSVEDPTSAEYEYVPGTRRFEVGTTSPLPYVGLQAAIETIEDVGLDVIQSRIERLTDRLKAGIDDERLLSPLSYESGLVTFEVDDPEATVERLAAEGIVVRSLPYPEGTVRASVHVFNTPADVDRLLDAL
jgi:selenocysteine lyase/cysteine desulfurase